MNSLDYLQEQLRKIEQDPAHPCFMLKASDISAHLVVEFWVATQRAMRDLMDAGATMTEAVESVREYHRVPRLAALGDSLTEKDRGALDIARAMMAWDRRKVAD